MSKGASNSNFALSKALWKARHSYRLWDLMHFFSQLKKFRALGGHIDSFYPIFSEGAQSAGAATGHYFHQDLLVANLIYQAQPSRHLDVGSRIDGFIAHVASFMPIEVLDVRPLAPTGHNNIRFVQANLMADLDPDWIGQYDSISCLHAIEHFGLGRYGDPLDLDGHLKGFENLLRLLKPGGMLYISFPIATKSAVEFNAHRKFHAQEILSWPTAGQEIILKRFDYVDDAGDLHQEVKLLETLPPLHYGCGIYSFKKAL